MEWTVGAASPGSCEERVVVGSGRWLGRRERGSAGDWVFGCEPVG